jgi:DNA invertase Pin-like site-specific DNA recombinase
VKELRAAGAEKIFARRRAAKADRAQLRRALAALEARDVLMVTRLDRLARSTRDLLNTLAAVDTLHTNPILLRSSEPAASRESQKASP